MKKPIVRISSKHCGYREFEKRESLVSFLEIVQTQIWRIGGLNEVKTKLFVQQGKTFMEVVISGRNIGGMIEDGRNTEFFSSAKAIGDNFYFL